MLPGSQAHILPVDAEQPSDRLPPAEPRFANDGIKLAHRECLHCRMPDQTGMGDLLVQICCSDFSELSSEPRCLQVLVPLRDLAADRLRDRNTLLSLLLDLPYRVLQIRYLSANANERPFALLRAVRQRSLQLGYSGFADRADSADQRFRPLPIDPLRTLPRLRTRRFGSASRSPIDISAPRPFDRARARFATASVCSNSCRRSLQLLKSHGLDGNVLDLIARRGVVIRPAPTCTPCGSSWRAAVQISVA